MKLIIPSGLLHHGMCNQCISLIQMKCRFTSQLDSIWTGVQFQKTFQYYS